MSKVKAQVSFAGTADLVKVRKQLKELKEKGEFEFYCCFLPRHIVIEKGFDTSIVDVLEEELGDDLIWQLKDYSTFAEAMANIETVRVDTANLVNRMFVLDSGTAVGVAKEIELFTRAKVILMP